MARAIGPLLFSTDTSCGSTPPRTTLPVESLVGFVTDVPARNCAPLLESCPTGCSTKTLTTLVTGLTARAENAVEALPTLARIALSPTLLPRTMRARPCPDISARDESARIESFELEDQRMIALGAGEPRFVNACTTSGAASTPPGNPDCPSPPTIRSTATAAVDTLILAFADTGTEVSVDEAVTVSSAAPRASAVPTPSAVRRKVNWSEDDHV